MGDWLCVRQVDALVLEVGLGGRYDATNAVPRGSVVATVVNTLDLEHTDMLGSTIESIAWEKVRGGGEGEGEVDDDDDSQ